MYPDPASKGVEDLERSPCTMHRSILKHWDFESHNDYFVRMFSEGSNKSSKKFPDRWGVVVRGQVERIDRSRRVVQ